MTYKHVVYFDGTPRTIESEEPAARDAVMEFFQKKLSEISTLSECVIQPADMPEDKRVAIELSYSLSAQVKDLGY